MNNREEEMKSLAMWKDFQQHLAASNEHIKQLDDMIKEKEKHLNIAVSQD